MSQVNPSETGDSLGFPNLKEYEFKVCIIDLIPRFKWGITF